MIVNLPKSFPIANLSRFTFGDAEAKEDNLLELCPCNIKPINEFLLGNKSIVLGERGAGKSALFRLVAQGKAKFADTGGKTQIIVPIDEELQYATIKEHVASLFKDFSSVDVSLQYRYVWEVFIVYRILKTLSDKGDGEVSALEKEFNESLGLSTKEVSFIQLLLAHKKTIGFKLDNLQTSNPTPNWYTSLEPSANISQSTSGAKQFVDIDSFKGKIAKFLSIKNAVVIILIDKLDEFVVKENYETQKKVIQGLLTCQRGYADYSQIKLKIFLRTDIFEKLDFQLLGFDKVSSKTVELRWSTDDIRQFIAKRIAWNYLQIMGLTSLQFTINEEKLYVDQETLAHFTESETSTKPRKMIAKLFAHRDNRDARLINLTDEINRQIITTIFPKRTDHLIQEGKSTQIDIFKYFETHFLLGTGKTTPRIVLIYLEKCLEHTRDYFNKNPGIIIELDKSNEYPLILRKAMVDAYKEFKSLMWQTFANIDGKWKASVLIFQLQKRNKTIFNYKTLRKIITISDENEFKQFLAFVSHIGLLQCLNSALPHEDRSYELPVLFR